MDKKLEMHELTLNTLMKYTMSHLMIIESITDETEAYIESELILSHIFEAEFIDLRIDFTKYIHIFDIKKLNRILIRRISGEPLAYIISVKYFWNHPFSVGYGVLIPRNETELLVEYGILEIKKIMHDKNKINVVDVGTGSGAIIISIAKNIKKSSNINFFAIDNSEYALRFCRENVKKSFLDDKIDIISSNLLDELHVTPHLIFANLPYIDRDNMSNLQKEIRLAEPREALDGGTDGIELIVELLKQLSVSSNRSFCTIMLEIGIDQDKKLKHIINKIMPGFKLSFIHDYQEIKRIAVIRSRN